MNKDAIIKLYLKYSDVFDEIKAEIIERDNLYYLCLNNKEIEFWTLLDLEKLLSLYNKKYILTKWEVLNL